MRRSLDRTLDHRDVHCRAQCEAQTFIERNRSSVCRPGVQEWLLAAALDLGRRSG